MATINSINNSSIPLNELTLSKQSVGFTIAGGASSKILTINNTIGLSGTDNKTYTLPLVTCNIQSQIVYNVKDYGATGDGTTDDTAAINATLDAAKAGGTVYFPKGIYRFTSTLIISDWTTTPKKYLNVVGENKIDTILDKDFNGVGIQIKGDSPRLENFTLDNTHKGTNHDVNDGIQLIPSANRVLMQNVLVQNQGGNGILFGEGNASTFIHVATYLNGGDGFKIDGIPYTNDANASNFIGIDTMQNAGIGFNVNSGFSHNIRGIVAKNNTGYGVVFNSNMNSVSGIYCEANTAGSVHVTTGAHWGSYSFESLDAAITDNSTGTNLIFTGYPSIALFVPNYLSMGNTSSIVKLAVYEDASDAIGFGLASNEFRMFYASTNPNHLSFGKYSKTGPTFTEQMRIGNDGTITSYIGNVPDADDGAYLGTASLGWSDLFLASGGVINWANGNMTLTHAAGSLQIDGGNIGINCAPSAIARLKVDGAYNNGAIIWGTATGGTGDLQAIYGYANSAAATSQEGVYGQASGAITTNYGVYGLANFGVTNYGIYGTASNPTGATTNVGVYGTAAGASNNYAFRSGVGDVLFLSLAGSGSRTVLADANGVLSAPVSDERLKKDIIPIGGFKPMEMLKDDKIAAINYSWKDEGKGDYRELGFTAQMFEPYDIQGLTFEDDGVKGLNYEKISCLLWEQNKQLLKRIEALETRNNLDLI